jgi:EmrB/QacA subfamily drug resistance transporter
MQKQQERNDWIVVLTIAVGTFMAVIDSSVVNVALPVIQTTFHASLSTVEWVVIAYLLVISSVLLAFGRLSDIYGQKRIYLVGLIDFTISSLLCGLAVSINMLILFRIVQALGAAMMFAVGPAIITNTIPPEKRGRGLSFTAISVSIGLVTGPVLGGFLVTVAGWSSIFFINIPIGILELYFIIRNIPSDKKKLSVPFDMIGSLLISTALVLILLPIEASAETSMKPVALYSLIGLGVAALIAFIIYETKIPHPILDLSLFKNRVFAAGNVAAVFSFIAVNIMVFLVPFYLEKLRMLTPATAGMLYIPNPLVTLIVAPISGVLSDHFDSRYFSTMGMGVLSIGLFMMSLLKVDSPIYYILISMAVIGMGMGLFQTPNNSAVLGNVPPQNRGIASGMLASMRNIGMAFGVAISGMLFTLFSNKADAIFTAQNFSSLQMEQATFIYALHHTFIIASLVALIAMAVSFVKGEVKTEKMKQMERSKAETNS